MRACVAACPSYFLRSPFESILRDDASQDECASMAASLQIARDESAEQAAQLQALLYIYAYSVCVCARARARACLRLRMCRFMYVCVCMCMYSFILYWLYSCRRCLMSALCLYNVILNLLPHRHPFFKPPGCCSPRRFDVSSPWMFRGAVL